MKCAGNNKKTLSKSSLSFSFSLHLETTIDMLHNVNEWPQQSNRQGSSDRGRAPMEKVLQQSKVRDGRRETRENQVEH
jgi:hypothetical protein